MNELPDKAHAVSGGGKYNARKRALRPYLALFALLPAMGILAIGINAQNRFENLQGHGVNATASVVAKLPRAGKRLDSVQLAFDAEGSPIKTWLNVSREEFARMQIGSSLEVTYLRENPTDVARTSELAAAAWSRSAINTFIAAGVWLIVVLLLWAFLEFAFRRNARLTPPFHCESKT